MSQVLPPSGSPPAAPPPAPPPGPPHHRTIVEGIHWPSVFEFTHLFRGFRLAMQPAKLIIALLAIVALYASGRTFDAVWGPQAYLGEIENYQEMPYRAYLRQRDSQTEDQRSELERRLFDLGDSNLDQGRIDALKDHPSAAGRVLTRAYIAKFQKDAADETPDQRADDAARLKAKMLSLQDTVGHGIFDAFMTYEIRQFDALIENTLTFVRISPIHGAAAGSNGENQTLSGGLFSKNPERLWRNDTVLGCLANMTVTAPSWLFISAQPMQWHANKDAAGTFKGWTQEWLLHRLPYLLTLFVLLAFWLVVLAASGGMICRISALEFAGAQEVSLPAVWRFVRARLGGFIAAPLMPLAIIAVLGAILTGMNLLGAIPYIGELLLGICFIFSLALALVMTLVVLGVIGGFNLMYPTIAVEGSDAFDACSRSWAYVYGAPWRLIAYSAIALVYGVITLLFVSFGAYLVLALAHTFAGFGAGFFGAAHGHYNGLPKLDTLWPMPKVNELYQPINWWAMNWSEWLGAVGLHFWVFLVITMVGAYVMSFHYSIHTVLYLLLRRAVEGQSINEVYREEPPLDNALAQSVEDTSVVS